MKLWILKKEKFKKIKFLLKNKRNNNKEEINR